MYALHFICFCCPPFSWSRFLNRFLRIAMHFSLSHPLYLAQTILLIQSVAFKIDLNKLKKDVNASLKLSSGFRVYFPHSSNLPRQNLSVFNTKIIYRNDVFIIQEQKLEHYIGIHENVRKLQSSTTRRLAFLESMDGHSQFVNNELMPPSQQHC